MHRVGWLPVCFKTRNKEHHDDSHIFPNVTGTLMSWKTCKELGILPDCYPNPTFLPVLYSAPTLPLQSLVYLSTSAQQSKSSLPYLMVTLTTWKVRNSTSISLMMQDPSVSALQDPFRIKLKTELGVLQSQDIITPVTEATDWCAPIVVAPKKNSDRIRMCVDLSHLN